MGTSTTLWGGIEPPDGSGTTVRDLLYAALRIARVLTAPGRGPSADALSDALQALNSMLDSWATQRIHVYAVLRDTYTLTAGTSAYTFGSGGTLGAVPPIRIESAGTIDDPTAATPTETPIEIFTPERWAAIAQRSIQSAHLEGVFVQRSSTQTIVYVYPVPSAAPQLVLYAGQALGQLSSLSSDPALTAGARRAVEYNLAAELADRWGVQLTPHAQRVAQDSLADLARFNSPGPPRLASDLRPTRGFFDTRTGRWSD